MDCIICAGSTELHVEKTFNTYDLDKVEYWRCRSCNFVLAKSLVDMNEKEWLELNHNYHSSYQFTEFNPDDRRWLERIYAQADVIADIVNLGLIPSRFGWIDYGCGDGKLSDELKEKYGIDLWKYDRYITDQNYIAHCRLFSNKYDLVVNTSVFEHVRNRKTLDDIASIVSDNGVIAVHTLVSENVPRDADWFYYLPVHCAFFSNKSMQKLFDDWGFKSSIYHVDSRLWFWFRNDPDHVECVIDRANNSYQETGKYYYFKRGFMDYWK